MAMQSTGYAIYFNGPSVFCFLLLMATLIVPRSRRSPAFAHQAEVLVSFACILAVAFYATPFLVEAVEQKLVPLSKERGDDLRRPAHVGELQCCNHIHERESCCRGSGPLNSVGHQLVLPFGDPLSHAQVEVLSGRFSTRENDRGSDSGDRL